MVLPWLAAAWLAGIAAAAVIPLQLWQWVSLSAVAGLGAWSARRSTRLAWVFLAGSCFFLGGLRATFADGRRASTSAALFAHAAQSVDIVGTVAGLPAWRGDRFVFGLRAESIAPASASSAAAVQGSVQVSCPAPCTLRRGETVVARGRLTRPSRFDDRQTAAILETTSVRRLNARDDASLTALLDRLRERMVTRLRGVLPAGEASLVGGVLLGADEQMPAEVQTAFRVTGTAHILAVSGFNVTIVAAAAATVFGRLLGARRGAAAAAAAIVFYTLLCGAEPAVVRAALMAGVALLALRLGRQSAALASLAAAAVVMTLWNPWVINDVGFQLSFLATLGLVIGAAPVQAAIQRWGEATIHHDGLRSALVPIAEIAALSLLAQAATLPLSAYVFQRLPLTALPANALILPAQPLLMATGALTALAALVSLPLGRLVAWLTWPLAAYTIRVAELFASLPGASLSVAPFPPAWLVAGYGALAGLVAVAKQPKAKATAISVFRLGGPVWIVILAATTVLVWRLAVERPDGRLSLTAFPGGEILVETPTGRFVALSAGQSATALAEALDGRLPLTHPELDWLVLTRAEIPAAEVVQQLGRHAPRGILVAGGGDQPIKESASPAPVTVLRADPRMELDLGRGAMATLVRTRTGETAVVIRFGLAEFLVWDCGARAGLQGITGATAVVLTGSGREVTRSLRVEVAPRSSLLLVAAPLPGDPFPEDLSGDASSIVMATPLQGWIRLSTDGIHAWVNAERYP